MKQLIIITTLLIIAFCASCVQNTHPKVIQFKLDMRHQENIKNVGVRGNTSPLSWNDTLRLTDENNGSIYEGSIKFNSTSFDLEFKFVKNNDFFELKGQQNRSITFEYKPETILYEAKFNYPDTKISKNN